MTAIIANLKAVVNQKPHILGFSKSYKNGFIRPYISFFDSTEYLTKCKEYYEIQGIVYFSN
jgi:hypothetical protein